MKPYRNNHVQYYMETINYMTEEQVTIITEAIKGRDPIFRRRALLAFKSVVKDGGNVSEFITNLK